jgi:hypothetical protein
MRFSVPRGDVDEMLLYIWKIIDLPNISYEDFLYKIIFEYFIFTPKDASSFIDSALSKGSLVRDEKSNVNLSDDLNQKFIEWQEKRQEEIKNNIKSLKKRAKIVRNLQNDDENKFNHILKKIVDDSALNRAVSVPDDAINLEKIDKKNGVLEAKIKGSEENVYNVKINLKEKTIFHNCHDFKTRRAKQKMFCKHLVKLFLKLKRENEDLAIYFLENIINKIKAWDFSS